MAAGTKSGGKGASVSVDEEEEKMVLLVVSGGKGALGMLSSKPLFSASGSFLIFIGGVAGVWAIEGKGGVTCGVAGVL